MRKGKKHWKIWALMKTLLITEGSKGNMIPIQFLKDENGVLMIFIVVSVLTNIRQHKL